MFILRCLLIYWKCVYTWSVDHIELFIKLLKKCSHRVGFRIGLSSKLWKLCIHTGSVSLMCRTVQQAPETVYTHGVSVPHVSDCPTSTGNCVYTRGLCPCETVQQAQEKFVCAPCLGSYRSAYKALRTVRHGVSFPVRLSSKHRKMCMYAMSVFISDCTSSTRNCVYTRGQCPCQTVQQALYTVCTRCLGSYLAVYQAAEAARTQNLAHCFEPRAQCEVTDKSLPASTVNSSGGNYERQDKRRLYHELDEVIISVSLTVLLLLLLFFFFFFLISKN